MSRIYGGRTFGRKLGSEGCHSGDGRGSVKMRLSWRLASASFTMEPRLPHAGGRYQECVCVCVVSANHSPIAGSRELK